MSRHIAPAVFWVAWRRICSRGPAFELTTSVMSPATKSRTIRKTEPVKVPIPTQVNMTLGPLTDGFGISVFQ